MHPTANEFSARGDHVFDRFAGHFPGARRWRLLIEQLLEWEDFLQIRSALLSYLAAVLQVRGPLTESSALPLLLAQRDMLPNYTRGGMLAPLREHTLEFNLLHRHVARCLARFPLADCVDGLDAPINVRLVYGAADSTRSAAPFSSSKVHSDVWAGVPADAAVVVLPVLGDIDNISIECGEMPVEQELAAMRSFDSYDAVDPHVDVKRWYTDANMKHGHWYIADARLLHRTVRRRAEGVRVSIDFRLRYNDLEYRNMLSQAPVAGPDAADARVPWDQWLSVGSQSLLIPRRTHLDPGLSSSSPVNLAAHSVLRLW